MTLSTFSLSYFKAIRGFMMNKAVVPLKYDQHIFPFLHDKKYFYMANYIITRQIIILYDKLNIYTTNYSFI